MILTCPQCESRFRLPAELLAPDGHNVRCSVCENIWFELPDPRELVEQQESEEKDGVEDFLQSQPAMEDIPEGVKPIPERQEVSASKAEEQDSGATNLRKAQIGGYAAATGVFFIILGALLGMHSTITQAWPASQVFYGIFGFKPHIPGDGLIFDRLQADTSGNELTIEGHIINLTSSKQALPAMSITLRNEAGEALESWSFKLPEKSIEKEGSLPFTNKHQPETKEAHDVALRFVLLEPDTEAKTASEDAGNIQAHSPDDHAETNDDAAHEESPEHASPPHH